MSETSAHSFEGHLERGDLHAAADWLVRAHGRDVLHLCTAIVRDRGTAEDLAQDAFGKAFQALPEFRGEASARTWLLTIARHRCLDHLRRSARQPWSLGREDDVREPLVADTEEALVSDLMARRADIREGLAVLSESERAMVLLRFAHGLSFDEIAESFGVKSGAVRMRVGRALTKMRDAIEAPPDFARAPVGSRAGAAPPPMVGAPAPAAYHPPPSPPPMLGGPPRVPPQGAPQPPASRSLFPSFTRIFEVFRGSGSAGAGAPVAPPPAPGAAEGGSLGSGGAPPPPPAFRSESTGSFSAAVDPGVALGALLLASAPDRPAEDAALAAFMARLGAQLPSPS